MGVVTVAEELCDGCGACAEACRFDAINLHDGIPLICDLCGGEPACVAVCPTGALSFEETEEEGVSPELALRELLRRWGILD